MKNTREPRTDRPAPRPAPRRAWTKPSFTEHAVCAEIGAYAFTA